MTAEAHDPYELIAAFNDAGKHDIAWKLCGKLLMDNPLNPKALVTGAFTLKSLGRYLEAYHYSRAATQIVPRNASAWTNFGHANALLWLPEEAEKAYKRGLECANTQDDTISLWVNLAALSIDLGRFEAALKWVEKILAVDPTNYNAIANQGFCLLGLRDWSGWKGYHNTIGTEWRKRVTYKQEPEWDGTSGQVVVLYADQGLGDEISFASMIPDVAARCKKLIVDCDGRLQGLFQRSFPQARIYGTRVKDTKWDTEDRNIDASLAMGQAGEFVRLKDSDFPGTAYLVSCPMRTEQWRTTFAKKRKPTIGIAWTGGVSKTNARNRRISLDDLLPVLSLDAHFVSLQYKDAAEEIAEFKAKHPHVDLVQYKWATLTDDYDDTAAIVAACDYVLCIQTAIARTAGALGVPCSVLLPTASNWFYSTKGEAVPWHGSLRVIRQQRAGSWSREVGIAAERIRAHFGELPGAARAVA